MGNECSKAASGARARLDEALTLGRCRGRKNLPCERQAKAAMRLARGLGAATACAVRRVREPEATAVAGRGQLMMRKNGPVA